MLEAACMTQLTVDTYPSSNSVDGRLTVWPSPSSMRKTVRTSLAYCWRESCGVTGLGGPLFGKTLRDVDALKTAGSNERRVSRAGNALSLGAEIGHTQPTQPVLLVGDELGLPSLVWLGHQ
jgi:hypothetical protein